MVEPLIVRPPETTDFGEMLVIVTGPTTHHSPLAYCPTDRSDENVHVISPRLTEVAAVAILVSEASRIADADSMTQNAFEHNAGIIFLESKSFTAGKYSNQLIFLNFG